MFDRHILLIGYGSLGQSLTPLLFDFFPNLKAEHIKIITADSRGANIASLYNLDFHQTALTPENYIETLAPFIHAGGILINLSVNVSSLALIDWCQANKMLYLDTCIEPWEGGYDPANNDILFTTNCWMRQQALHRKRKGETTCVVAHGANPGLVTHFLKIALEKLAVIEGVDPNQSHATIAYKLGIKAIHIAERDTQDDRVPLRDGEFANTWSVDGLLSEARQQAEISWGSHEMSMPIGAIAHDGSGNAGILFKERSAELQVRTWTPTVGPQLGYLITHHENFSIADYLTIAATADTQGYRPTVAYAYRPCPKTCMSLRNWEEKGFAAPAHKTVMTSQVQTGYDELGVLLMRSSGSYWFGSTLNCFQAQKIAPHNNATTMQVGGAILGALSWMDTHPCEGVVEAEEMDSHAVLSVAMPYLGMVRGTSTSWLPDVIGSLTFGTFIEKRR